MNYNASSVIHRFQKIFLAKSWYDQFPIYYGRAQNTVLAVTVWPVTFKPDFIMLGGS